MRATNSFLQDEDALAVERAPAPVAINDELASLRKALRDCRERLRRGALESTQRICVLTSELTRMENLNSVYRRRLDELSSDEALVDLARRLIQYREENERLRRDVCRIGVLEKALRDAHAECERMAVERDSLALELVRLQQASAAV